MKRSAAGLAALLVAAACSGSDSDTSGGSAAPIVTDAPGSVVTDPSPESSTTPAPTTTTTTTTTSTTTTTTVVAAASEIRVNHIQTIGSHNSFHLVPDPVLFDGIAAVSAELARDIEYSHRPLVEQLDEFGIRQLELDVFADPEGGLYSDRAANVVVGLDPASGDPLLDEPGFKVLHTQDFDYESTCPTLVLCLSEVDAWSLANPTHVPITILVELKDLSVPDAAAAEGVDLDVGLPWTEPVATTSEILDQLDAEIRSVFGPERLLEPDEVRGDAATLDEAVTTTGWPLLDDVRGQIIVALNNDGEQRDLFVAETPTLEGRAMFTSSTPGAPDAAFLRFDDPTDPGLDAAATAGYLIRTRTDSPTLDARDNDTTRRDTAFVSGAHLFSTDYYEPSTFFDSPYVVRFDDGAVARCNPVTAPPECSPDQIAE